MEQIWAGFKENDSLKDLFAKYKDAFGYLFRDGDKYLCNDDYQILYQKLADFAKWDQIKMYADKYCAKYWNNDVFLRLFGIYLREATYRYAGDFTDDGAFWNNLQKGLLNDLNLAFRKKNIPIYPRILDRNNYRPDTFWLPDWGIDCIQKELTDGSKNCLIRQIFKSFKDEFCHVSDEKQSFVYVRHLIRLAGCPLNYNPVRNNYDELRRRKSRNEVENYVNDPNRSTLKYASKLQFYLTDRICDFFDFLGDLEPAVSFEKAQDQLEAWCGIKNKSHYYYDWIKREFRICKDTRNRKQLSKKREIDEDNEDVSFDLIYNKMSQKVSISCPSASSISHFLRKNGLEPRYSYKVFVDDSELFVIAPYGHIKGCQSISEDKFNCNILKLFTYKEVEICEEDGLYQKRMINPWVKKVCLLDELSLCVYSLSNGSCYYLVLPPEESVFGVNGGRCDLLEEVSGGLNVYRIYVDDNAEELLLSVNGRILDFNIQDPRYVHLYQEFNDRSTIFVHQKSKVKFGIGKVHFSHLGEKFNYASLKLPSDLRIPQNADPKHLTITSVVPKPVLIPETNVGDKIIPQTVLLPFGWNFWVAGNDSHFHAYIKTSGKSMPSSLYWKHLESNLYEYIVDDYELWRKNGFPIRFLSDNGVVLNAKCPYFNVDTVRNGWKNSKFFLNANPFNDVIPKNGKYYFSWIERNCKFKVEVPYDDERISLSRCMRSLGLIENLPELTFGWSCEKTMFTEVFPASKNYCEPNRPEWIYKKNEKEREELLLNLIKGKTAKELLEEFKNKYDFVKYFSNELMIEIEKMFTYEWHCTDDESEFLERIMQLYFQIDANRYREDLCGVTENKKKEWWSKRILLTAEKHNGLIELLNQELRDNDILNNEVFLWSFVDEHDVKDYVKYCENKKLFLLKQKRMENNKIKLNAFLDFWYKSCDSDLKDFPMEELLLNNESFGNCSPQNFDLCACCLNAWLSSYVGCLDLFQKCQDCVVPGNFFAEVSLNYSVNNCQNIKTLKDISKKRIELFTFLKSENERFGVNSLCDEEIMIEVMPPVKFGCEIRSYNSFESLKESYMIYSNIQYKEKLWICLIKKKWKSIYREDLCEKFDKILEEEDYQEELKSACNRQMNSDYCRIPIHDELVKLANHLRRCFRPLFRRELDRWNNIEKNKPNRSMLSKCCIILPPEIFLNAPEKSKECYEYIENVAEQLESELEKKNK